MSLRFIYLENKNKAVTTYIDMCNLFKQSGEFSYQSDVQFIEEYIQKFEDKVSKDKFQISYEKEDDKMIIEILTKNCFKSVTDFLEKRQITYRAGK